MNWRTDTWFFDTEVLPHVWILCAVHKETKQKKLFVNQPNELYDWFQTNPILCGYNSKHYDMHVVRAILGGCSPEEVKKVSDAIVGGEQGWNIELPYCKLPIAYDLMLDLPTRPSLKMIEGNMGYSIVESSVDFNTENPTEQELQELISYCFNDVEALIPLWEKRLSYLEAKETLADMMKIDVMKCLDMTNAKLVALFLGAKKKDWNDEREYIYPSNLKRENIPSEVFDFFDRLHDYSIPLEILFGKEDEYDESGEISMRKSKNPYKSLLIDIADCPHKVAWGGLHGARKNYTEQTDDERVILNYDVASYYPSLMIKNHYLSRNIPNPDVFEEVFHKRIEAKKNGDKKTANALKLVLNTTYGASNNQYNELYDPLMAHSVCISGQLYLIELINSLLLFIDGFTLIQSNTDGIMFSVPRKAIDTVHEIVLEWSNRTGFNMEEDIIDKVVQRDVNNYVIRKADKSVKVKGGAVSTWEGGDFKSASLSIVAKAIVLNLLDDIPIEDTINSCNDVQMFQIISKTGGTYCRTVWEIEDDST